MKDINLFAFKTVVVFIRKENPLGIQSAMVSFPFLQDEIEILCGNYMDRLDVIYKAKTN